MLDPVHETLNPKIWGSLDKLLPEVKMEIIQKIKSLLGSDADQILSLWFIGGGASLQYNNYSDIDINVVMNTDEIRPYHLLFKKHNSGMDYLTGTYHPINYFATPNIKMDWGEETSSIYLIKDFVTGDEDIWVRPYIKGSDLRNPEDKYRAELPYSNLISKVVRYKIRELVKDLNDLKHLSGNRNVMIAKLKEIDNDIKELGDEHKKLDSDRKFSYSFGWGIPKFGLDNLSYKYMEREGLLELLDSLDNIS